MDSRSDRLRPRLVGIALGLLALSSCGRIPPPAAPPPPAVTVDLPIQRPVTNYGTFTGRTEAVASAEIRARVPGYLVGLHYELASEVEEGKVLFTIEKETYAAHVARAEALVASSEAELQRAQADLERVEEAVKTNAVSKQEVALRMADRDIAQAALLEAQATLVQEELNLSYCDVKTPIAGQVSRNLVDVGNLVGSGQNTLLATVAKMDPIFAYFEVSESFVLESLATTDRSNSTVGERALPAFMGLGDGTDFPFEGAVDYIDNRVDPETGTIQVRASFPNADRKLYPGLYARLRLPGREIPDGVLVEEQAIGFDLGGRYVLTVDDQNEVHLQHVEVGALEGELRVVISGLEADQRYIVDGRLRARAGMPCNPTMRELSADAPAQD